MPGEEAVVVMLLDEDEEPPAGDGFTTVVLFSVFLSAGGLVVSVFCSQAASNAAPARMQIIFFIGLRWMPNVGYPRNRRKKAFRSCALFFED